MQPATDKVFKIFRKNYREIPLIPVSKTPFQALVAVMLSARTRDEVTARVCQHLFRLAPTPDKVAGLGIGELEKILHPIGFYKAKAKYLKKMAQKLAGEFNSKVPRTLEALTSLPGVGRKTANIILARVFNIPAIGVDTHVHRIANTLSWVHTKTPQATEKELTKVLPKKYWVDINHLFVSIGQQYRTKKSLENFLKKTNLI